MSLPPASFRTAYLFFACSVPVVVAAAREGQLLEGVIAAAIVGPFGLSFLWATRNTHLMVNWWDLGGDNA